MEHTKDIDSTLVVEAPHRDFAIREHQLFLAGGITNCPDWQSEIIEELQDYPDLTILNPKRTNYPMNDPEAAEEQITWEFDHLQSATEIAVWFSRGSVNPIALYELGMWVNSHPGRPAFVGADPEYPRAQDVLVQTKLARPEIEVVRSVGALATQIREYLD